MLSVNRTGLAPIVFHWGTPMNRNKLKIRRRALLAVSVLFAALLATAGNAGSGNSGIGDAGSVATATREVPIGRYRSVEL